MNYFKKKRKNKNDIVNKIYNKNISKIYIYGLYKLCFIE